MTSVYAPETYMARVASRWPIALIVMVGALALLALAMAASDTALINAAAKDAIEKSVQHDVVRTRLGEPVAVGQPSGSVSSQRERSRVEIVVPVRGSRSQGRVYGSAVVEDGLPRLTSLTVVVGTERISIPLDAESGRSSDAGKP